MKWLFCFLFLWSGSCNQILVARFCKFFWPSYSNLFPICLKICFQFWKIQSPRITMQIRRLCARNSFPFELSEALRNFFEAQVFEVQNLIFFYCPSPKARRLKVSIWKAQLSTWKLKVLSVSLNIVESTKLTFWAVDSSIRPDTSSIILQCIKK